MVDAPQYQRHSIRLKGYDYSLPGAYFITVLSYQIKHLFGIIASDAITLNKYGDIVLSCWKDLENHYNNLKLDSFVIMPNHIHGILIIKDMNLAEPNVRTGSTSNVRAGLRPAPTKPQTLSEIVRAFKSFSARRINELRDTPGLPVWQRNYYERVIRNDDEMNAIRRYIKNNVINWPTDKDFPEI